MICVLIFVMSTRIGANDEIAGNLGTIGVYGLLSTVIIFIMTILVTYITRKLLGFDAKGKIAENAVISGGETSEEVTESTKESDDSGFGKLKIDKMAVFIVVFVVLGLISGRFLVNKVFSSYEDFESAASMMLRISLSILMFFVGFEIGIDDSGGGDFRTAGLKVLLFPVTTIVGAVLGGIVLASIIPVTLRESLAIASGFGWYSMAPVLIMESGHLTASAISFVNNLTRELLSMLIVPFVARYVGYIEAACMPGSPSMDVCLPIIERSTNSTTVVYAFLNGFLVSGTVPILVPLFLGV
jgi:uncharacterized membrane protein YbjE (DUF340 family)